MCISIVHSSTTSINECEKVAVFQYQSSKITSIKAFSWIACRWIGLFTMLGTGSIWKCWTKSVSLARESSEKVQKWETGQTAGSREGERRFCMTLQMLLDTYTYTENCKHKTRDIGCRICCLDLYISIQPEHLQKLCFYVSCICVELLCLWLCSRCSPEWRCGSRQRWNRNFEIEHFSSWDWVPVLHTNLKQV